MSTYISSGNTRLDAQMKFTAEIDKMTSVLRRTLLIDGSRRENDAEHSWHISVMALIFSEYAVEKPNPLHAVEMALVHALVEVYAGDTFAYDTSEYQTKSQREEQAADKLFSILPPEQGEYIRSLWEEFEACETVDSKYANCLDRLQPFYHNTLTQGHTWQESSPRPTSAQVAKRMEILREFMPQVHKWVEKNIEHAIEKGWLIK